MSLESTTIIITDMQDHVQGITYEVNRIAALYKAAAEKQDSGTFLRNLYKAELANLEALIAIEENLYKHAEYLRVTAGVSESPGGDFPGGLDRRRETRRGDR